MNKLEYWIYQLVKNNPAYKSRIVDSYQLLLSLIPQKSIITNYKTIERDGYFFGFHDKTPFSNDGKMLLAHKIHTKYRELQPDDEIEVGYFSGEDWRNFHSIGRTTGWNWQMGSMLQWRGLSCDEVVYNVEVDGVHKSLVFSTKSQNVTNELPWPVVHVSSDGLLASSYNFHRAEKAMPGYGLISEFPDIPEAAQDFFRIFSIDSFKVEFKISLEEIQKISPSPSMSGAFHFFHHSLFSPNSKRVFFLHRWIDRSGRRWTRMFSVDVNGKNLYLFPMDEMVSHITWASETEIFSYLRFPGHGEGYFLVKDQVGSKKKFFQNILNSDGHPTFNKESNLVVTDTYPDRFRNQYLILMDTKLNERTNLLRTHLPIKFKRFLQVDLHPRFHPYLPIVCVDSAHKGRHSLITLDYSKKII